jgi:hypothetical protein
VIVAKTIAVNCRAKSRLRSSLAPLMALLIAILLFPVGKSWAAGGYTYTQVRQFPSSDPNNPTGPAENLCDMALNDLGQVAYVTSQANADGTQTEHIHVWMSSGVDKIIYSGTTDVLLNPPTNYPYCGGTGGNSLGLAIDNRGVVSAQEWILMSVSPTNGNLYTYGLMFIDSGLVSGNTQYVITSQTIAYALTGNHANASGYRPYFSGSESGNFLGAYSATSQLGPPTDLGFYTDSQISYHPIPAINDAGQISLLAAQVDIATGFIGPLTLIDVAPTPGTNPVYTVIGAPSWTALGQLGMNNRGDAAFLTTDAFRLVEQPANRSTAVSILADASTFSQSTASRPLSFSDWNEATFLTSDASGSQDLWSIGPDKTAVEVLSSLDTAINVFNPSTQTTAPLLINGYGFSFGGDNVGTSTEIAANNQGAVLIPGPVFLMATPLPGLRPSAPLNPDSPTTNLMTFSAPCASFYSGSGFLTPALTFGSFTGTCYVYPALAANYTVNATSGADNFQSITVPAPLAGGQTTFGLSYVPSNAPLGTSPTTASLIAGQPFNFPAGGVAAFTILGINTSQALNSNNLSTFVLGLSWVNHGSVPTGFTMQLLADNGPTVTPAISGTVGNNGWYTSNAVVTWTVTDPLNPVLSESGCGSTSVTADTTGQSVTCTASTAGGSTSKTVTLKRDATPPVASAAPSPVPNGNGWNKTAVTVSFTGTDATSGLATCSAAVTVSAQGATQTSPTGTCTDNAGNVSAPVSATNINIDETPPVVTGSAAPAANGNGWNNSSVTVTFTATDSLSGVAATGCQAPVVLSTNGSGQSVSGSCADKAGNPASTTVSGINIDTIPPVATATVLPAANGAGWNNTAVTVSFSGTDSLNGSGVASCSPNVILANPGAAQSATGTCADKAGNLSAQAKASVSIDETPPTVSITTPANGASYALGSSVSAAFTCADALSGVASCLGTLPNGTALNTTTAGTYGFTVTGTDAAGNAASATASYSIIAATTAYTLTPSSYNFGTVAIDSTNGLQAYMSNAGTTALPITSITLTGGNAGQFTATSYCGTSLAAGSGCAIVVLFNPTSAGVKSSTLKVVAGGITKTIPLSGTGVAASFSLDPASIVFADQVEGVASAPMTVTITNTGNVALPLTATNISGTNSAQFSIQSTDLSGQNLCGSSLPVGLACEIDVTFLPKTTGAKTATLKVKAGAGAGEQNVALSGTGIAATLTLSPTSVAFGDQTHGTSSTSQRLTLANTGTTKLPITVSVTGQFSETNNCAGSVSPGMSCPIDVTFAPTSKGAKTGTVKVTVGSGASASSTTAALSGIGT